MAITSSPPQPTHAPVPAAEKSAGPTSSASSGPPKQKRKRIVRIVVALVILCAVAYGIRSFVTSLGHESTDNAQINGQLDPVIPRVAGLVDALLVNDNDHVTVGQPLLRLQTHDLDVKVSGAESALAQAQANLQSTRANAIVA